MRRKVGGVAGLLLLLAASAAFAADQPATIPVEPVKQVRKGVDAWPLIQNPRTPAEIRVNAALTKLNQRLQQALATCDDGARASFKQMGEDAPKDQDPTEGDWRRSVQITMQGPRFLSLVASDEVFCGGAHPDTGTMAMVFDLTTGAPVNWLAMVPKSAAASTHADTVSDGSTVSGLALAGLAKINLAAADQDCNDAFVEGQSFQLWPDARAGTLVAQAFDLPHVVAACAAQIPLSLEQARGLGFDESLLGAIEEAHRLGVKR
jgi:hypothetical protein